MLNLSCEVLIHLRERKKRYLENVYLELFFSNLLKLYFIYNLYFIALYVCTHILHHFLQLRIQVDISRRYFCNFLKL